MNEHNSPVNAPIIQRIEIWPVDIPITDQFVVATGARVTAQNLFMRVTLRNGTQGVGEAAPFPEVGGEDRATCFAAATELAKTMSRGRPRAGNRHHHPDLQSGKDAGTRTWLVRQGIPPL